MGDESETTEFSAGAFLSWRWCHGAMTPAHVLCCAESPVNSRCAYEGGWGGVRSGSFWYGSIGGHEIVWVCMCVCGQYVYIHTFICTSCAPQSLARTQGACVKGYCWAKIGTYSMCLFLWVSFDFCRSLLI